MRVLLAGRAVSDSFASGKLRPGSAVIILKKVGGGLLSKAFCYTSPKVIIWDCEFIQITSRDLIGQKNLLGGSKGVFVTAVFVKRWKVTKKDISWCGQTMCLLAIPLLG